MSHSAELIELIAAEVRKTYPPERGFSYVIEQRIAGIARVMMPDIQVLNEAGKVVCAVEIGYTRPEKLTAYRTELGIEDVRWYDKAGRLHGDVTVVTTIRREVVEPAGGIVFRTIPVTGMVCHNCVEQFTQTPDPDEWYGDGPPEAMDHDSAIEAACEETFGDVIDNGVRMAALVTCEACEASWIETDAIELACAMWDPGDFADQWLQLKRRPIDEISRMLRESSGLSPGPQELTHQALVEYARASYGVDLDYSAFQLRSAVYQE